MESLTFPEALRGYYILLVGSWLEYIVMSEIKLWQNIPGVDCKPEYHSGGDHIEKYKNWYGRAKAVGVRIERMSKINKVGDR